MKKGWVFIFVLVIAIGILTLIYFLKPDSFKFGFEKKGILGSTPSQPNGVGPNIAPLKPSSQKFTISEVFSKAAQEGPSFCDKLEQQYMVIPCKKDYFLRKAVNENNPNVCDGWDDPALARQCKADAIITLVAIAYKSESIAKGDSNVVPSNIALCDQLVGSEKEFCKNPKGVIKQDYNKIVALLKYK